MAKGFNRPPGGGGAGGGMMAQIKKMQEQMEAAQAQLAVETVIDESVVRDIIPQLKALGAEGIIEYPLNKLVY